jgi:hypothetical protein
LPEQLAAFGSQLTTSYALPVAAASQLPVSSSTFQVSGLSLKSSTLSTAKANLSSSCLLKYQAEVSKSTLDT